MADEKGYLLGQRAADAVRDLVNRRSPGDGPRATHEPRSAPVVIVKATSGGWYSSASGSGSAWSPGQWQAVDHLTCDLSDGGPAWLRDPNGADFTQGDYYLALRYGQDPVGYPRFAAVPGQAGAAPAFSGAFVFGDSALTVANNTLVTCTFNDERYDAGNYFTVADNTKLTVPSDGHYLVSASVKWTANNNGFRYMQLYRSGSAGSDRTVSYVHPVQGGNYTAHTVTMIASASAGDYFLLDIKQTCGGNLDSPERQVWISKIG